ncbi:hypothetical protein [Actinoplanes sp. NPDC026623]|uniref:hypothetical protein n=1 Tax=Actinoplanes sp. NPDC026623 TaxID=3155610 RepID=UPI0033CFDBD0
MWTEFLAAATPHPVHVTVAADGGTGTAPAVAARLDAAGGHLHLLVSRDLLRESAGRLAAELLDAVVPALVAVAEQHPHPRPIAVWRAEPSDPEPGCGPSLDTELESLDDEDELMLIGRLDGTRADGLARYHLLDDYVGGRLEEPGIAARADTSTSGPAVHWILELGT